MSRTALRAVAFALALVTSGAASARADDEGGHYPRPSVGAVIGAAPSRIGGGTGTGAFVSGNAGIRFNEWLQWDVFDGSGFWSEQTTDLCLLSDPCGDAKAMFLGSAVRGGFFRKPRDGKQLPNGFLIGGIGAGRLTSTQGVGEQSDWGIAGNVGAGVEIPFGEHFTAGVTYRFFVMDDDLSDEVPMIHAIGFEFGWR